MVENCWYRFHFVCSLDVERDGVGCLPQRVVMLKCGMDSIQIWFWGAVWRYRLGVLRRILAHYTSKTVISGGYMVYLLQGICLKDLQETIQYCFSCDEKIKFCSIL
jgi:hypothetical protein